MEEERVCAIRVLATGVTMVAEGNLGIISMWKTFKLYMLSTSSML